MTHEAYSPNQSKLRQLRNSVSSDFKGIKSDVAKYARERANYAFGAGAVVLALAVLGAVGWSIESSNIEEGRQIRKEAALMAELNATATPEPTATPAPDMPVRFIEQPGTILLVDRTNMFTDGLRLGIIEYNGPGEPTVIVSNGKNQFEGTAKPLGNGFRLVKPDDTYGTLYHAFLPNSELNRLFDDEEGNDTRVTVFILSGGREHETHTQMGIRWGGGAQVAEEYYPTQKEKLGKPF